MKDVIVIAHASENSLDTFRREKKAQRDVCEAWRGNSPLLSDECFRSDRSERNPDLYSSQTEYYLHLVCSKISSDEASAALEHRQL